MRVLHGGLYSREEVVFWNKKSIPQQEVRTQDVLEGLKAYSSCSHNVLLIGRCCHREGQGFHAIDWKEIPKLKWFLVETEILWAFNWLLGLSGIAALFFCFFFNSWNLEPLPTCLHLLLRVFCCGHQRLVQGKLSGKRLQDSLS